MRDDNTIRLKDNKQYCLTADMDKNTKEPIDNSNMFLSKCKTDKHGQDFNYNAMTRSRGEKTRERLLHYRYYGPITKA